MNTIEAMQKAQNGFVVTNHLAKMFATYFVYQDACMHAYTLVGNQLQDPQIKEHFSLYEVLCNSWEFYPSNTFTIEK